MFLGLDFFFSMPAVGLSVVIFSFLRKVNMVPQPLGYVELIFYPPALSFIKLRRLPVDKLTQNLVTVLVTEVF
jgi:hypothetical protein